MDDLAKARKYALSLLKIRPRSEKDIRERLSGKGFADATSNAVLAVLKKSRDLDDLKLAGLLIEEAERSNLRSKDALAEYLSSKGIEGTVIEQAFSANPVNDRKNAVKLVRERLAAVKGLPAAKVRSRLYALLVRKGFDGEMAEEIVNQEIASSPDGSEGSSQ